MGEKLNNCNCSYYPMNELREYERARIDLGIEVIIRYDSLLSTENKRGYGLKHHDVFKMRFRMNKRISFNKLVHCVCHMCNVRGTQWSIPDGFWIRLNSHTLVIMCYNCICLARNIQQKLYTRCSNVNRDMFNGYRYFGNNVTALSDDKTSNCIVVYSHRSINLHDYISLRREVLSKLNQIVIEKYKLTLIYFILILSELLVSDLGKSIIMLTLQVKHMLN